MSGLGVPHREEAGAAAALRPARRFGALRAVLAILALVAAAWTGGLVWFVAGLDQPVEEPDTATDAIVVLTGGSQRFDNGLALLAEGKAKKLFVSGVHHGVDTADMLRGAHAAPHWVQCCIVLGHSADNTVGNAIETAEWLRREGYRSIRLVTANYHMRRSLLEFRRVLPGDVTIIAQPVFPEGARQGSLWSWRGTAPVILTEYMKYLGALIRPMLPLPPASRGQA